MKKHIIFIAIVSLSLFLFSCKDKDAFTISGTITNPGSLKKIYLLEADSTGFNPIDSTNLSDQGKFQFKHAAPYANIFKIRVGGSAFQLIAKNGDAIEFSNNLTDNTHAYQISGSEEADKVKEFNKITDYYVDKTGKITQEYEDKAQAIGKETDSLINIYRPLFNKNMDEYAKASLKFGNENKNALEGFYAVVISCDPGRHEQQMIAYADAIKDGFKDNPAVQQFIKQMMKLKPVSIGHAAPEFTIGGLDGKPVKLSDYKGKYVMLDFWASWCGPCRHENPNVVKQYAIYKPLGLNILGISLDVDKGAWQQAINNDKLTWQHASDLKTFEGPVERLYNINAIPSNFIIDPQGIIIAKNITGADLEEFLNKTFSKSQQIVKIK